MNNTLDERFWANVDKSAGPEGCWPWTGTTDEDGYGRFNVGGRPIRAHRYVFGVAAERGHVLHKCDNPPCCNRDHLSLGTHLDNMRDKAAKGRAPSQPGGLNGRAKLTRDQVATIRQRSESSRFLAKEYGVHHTTIYRVRLGLLWQTVSSEATAS